MRSPPPLWRVDRRPLGYREAWALQRELVEERKRGEIPDVLLLTEHPPVFTLGRRGRPEHLLAAPEQLGAEVIRTDRGGEVTFHGPGQLVAYPILDLTHTMRDVRAYLRTLEKVGILAAERFGIAAGRRPGLTGVWCDPGGAARKLASIGVRISRWVTSHGLALNASTELAWFSRIVPCGLPGCPATSLSAEAGRPVPVPEAADRFAEAFAGVFDRRLVPAPTGFFAGRA